MAKHQSPIFGQNEDPAAFFRSNFGINSAQQATEAVNNTDALWRSGNHEWMTLDLETGKRSPSNFEDFKATANQVKNRYDTGEYQDGDLPKSEPDEDGRGLHGRSTHVANESSDWKAVCTAPDYCKVGNGVVPFDSFANIGKQTQSSPDVKAQGTPIYRVGDMHQGVAADAGEGIPSGTSGSGGYVKFLTGQDNIKVNGIPMVRQDSLCLVNCNAAGFGGALGKVTTVDKGAQTEAEPLDPDAPPGKRTSEKLQQLETLRDALQEGQYDFDSWDSVVDFQSANQMLDDQLAKLQGTKFQGGGVVGQAANAYTDLRAQVVRGALGFGKDIVMGVGELAYMGVKGAGKLSQRTQTPQGQLLTQIDAEVLGENIRLGNVTAGSTA